MDVSHLEVSHAMDGIMKTVKETRRASVEKLVENGTETLNAMLEHGTTTVEAKSGYGLTIRDELKILEAVDRLNQMHSVDLVPTFLGAHAVPPEFANNPEDYVSLVVNEMIPKVPRKVSQSSATYFARKVSSAWISQGVCFLPGSV